MYSNRHARNMGDMVLLNPSDSFRLMVAERSDKTMAVEVLNSDRENSHLIGRIKEVLPHEVYVVEAHQTIKVGNKDHEIVLRAKMREQDIGPDDGSSTDSLFDVSLEVVNRKEPGAQKAEKGDDKKDTKKEEKGKDVGPTVASSKETSAPSENDKEKAKEKNSSESTDTPNPVSENHP